MWGGFTVMCGDVCFLHLGLNGFAFCAHSAFMHFIAHETAVCHNSHSSSNWDSCITRQLGYKHTICQNLVFTQKKKCLSLYFCKNRTWSVKELSTFFLSAIKLCIGGLQQVAVSSALYDSQIILIYIQQDATLHSLFYLETALHVSGGTITRHQEHKQLYLQHLVFVTPLLLSSTIATDSSNSVTNTRCCRYSCLRSWWRVMVPLETCRAVSI